MHLIHIYIYMCGCCLFKMSEVCGLFSMCGDCGDGVWIVFGLNTSKKLDIAHVYAFNMSYFWRLSSAGTSGGCCSQKSILLTFFCRLYMSIRVLYLLEHHLVVSGISCFQFFLPEVLASGLRWVCLGSVECEPLSNPPLTAHTPTITHVSHANFMFQFLTKVVSWLSSAAVPSQCMRFIVVCVHNRKNRKFPHWRRGQVMLFRAFMTPCIFCAGKSM